MKTTRSQVFETNSSSTHSVSLITSPNGYRDTTMLPDENGVVHIGTRSVIGGGTIHAKAKFILDFAEYIDHHKEVEEWIKEFTGAREIKHIYRPHNIYSLERKERLLSLVDKDWANFGDNEEDDELEEFVCDIASEWYLASGDYSDKTSGEELEAAKQIVMSKEKTLDFIFKSTNGFDVSEYYDS